MKFNGITLHGCAKFKKVPVIPENSRLKSIASGTAEVFKLDPRLIQRDPGFNTRYDFGNIQLLAEDILENGVLDPLKVRKEDTAVFLVNGDRRLSAILLLIQNGLWPADPKNLGYPMPVPCTSEGVGVKPLDRIFMMLSLNTGKPFTLLEKGFAYQNILVQDPEINASEIARRSGETKQAVSNALILVRKASPVLIDHIKQDRLSGTTALEIANTTDDHIKQEAIAQKAIAAATASGRDHATPKDLPAKPKKDPKPVADLWEYEPAMGDFGWNPDGRAETPTSALALGMPKSGITLISLHVAQTEQGSWRHSFTFRTKKSGAIGLPELSGESSTDENHAMHAAWKQLAPHIVAFAKEQAPLTGSVLLKTATALGNSLHARFVTGQDHDDALFAASSLSTINSQPSTDDDDPEPLIEDHSKDDKPADPEAYKRLKDAKPTNRDGSGSSGAGGGGGSGYADSDARIKNIEEMLDALDKDKCNPGRWETLELFLDYLQGSHTVATLKKHLAK